MQGKLKSCLDFWKNTLEAPQSVLSIISNGYVLPFKNEPPTNVFSNHGSCKRYDYFIDESVRELLANNCIQKVVDRPHVCNPLSVVCNRKGKCRLVVDLCFVNRYLWKYNFKYEDIRTVLSMFSLGDYVIT